MRHFSFLSEPRVQELFERPPQDFAVDDAPDRLALALGATLYSPASRPDLARDVLRCAAAGATSMVLCLEDAIAAADVPAAEGNVVEALQELHNRGPRVRRPMLFVRVRHVRQIEDLTVRLGPAAAVLSGFVLPKVTPASGAEMLDAVVASAQVAGRRLYAMPVLESPEILWRESRVDTLIELGRLFTKFRAQVLAVRIGGTDLCGLHGIRRTRDMTIYDVKLVADVIADAVNVLGRAGDGWRIAGPVWEYYETPDLDTLPRGLMREVELDRANGLTGKSAIHPSQLSVVHGMAVVAHEDHVDARAVVERSTGPDGVGAVFAGARGRMTEPAPHDRWAREVLARAELFGVARPGVGPDELIRGARS